MNRHAKSATLVVALMSLLALLLASACTVDSNSPDEDGNNKADSSPSAEAEKTEAPVQTAVSMNPPDGATDVNPLTPLELTANDGTMTSVSVTNNEGGEVEGTLSKDKKVWKSAEPLGYGRTYSALVKTLSDKGITSQFNGSLQTVTPNNQTAVSTIPSVPGDTFGVGMPLIVRFDEPITDKDKAEKYMKVTTSPKVEGAWYWFSDMEAHWRPKDYYKPGTKVDLKVDVYGRDLGGGLYGQADVSTDFVVGDSMVSEISNSDKQLRVYKNGELVRTMPASLGMAKYPSQSGIHVVQEKHKSLIMDSSTWGLPTDDPDGYYEKVPYATRISMSGEFVHAAPWSVPDQGVRNVSHGCINVSLDNGIWFYENSTYGDIVVITGTEVDLKPEDGWGDWNIPWDTWKAGNK
ncbi:MAG: Ig-like domain-containing protein [Cumulibacter sp.]